MVIAALVQHEGDVFVVRRTGRRVELLRTQCAHASCPFRQADILGGGLRLPAVPKRLATARVLSALALDALECVDAGLALSDLFDAETRVGLE